ncbi:MAG: hypothetical protein JXB88_20475 [Spirochaetales bacterium]|nr:hypothetical protein [Spirochaetales bacterium]
MDMAILVDRAKKLINRYHNDTGIKLYLKAREFLRVHAGEKSTFFEMLDKLQDREMYESEKIKAVYDQVEAFIEYVESGLFQISTLEQKIKTEIILDFLDRAKTLLKEEKNHPACAVILIGSVLEEFLKDLLGERGLQCDPKKENIPGYAQVLKKAQLLTRQDMTDIMNWHSLYTHALEGEWEEVNDRKRIIIMYEGVLLLLRKYLPS